MSSTAGRKAKVYWSADNTDDSYHLIAGIDTVTGGPESPEITDDEFGVEYEQSIPGIIGLPFTMSGGARVGADSTGQDAMITAQLAGSTPNGYVAVIFDGNPAGGSGWLGAVNITKISFDTKTRDKTNISIDGKTTGAFTFGAITLPVT
jgi:hypothetical protein